MASASDLNEMASSSAITVQPTTTTTTTTVITSPSKLDSLVNLFTNLRLGRWSPTQRVNQQHPPKSGHGFIVVQGRRSYEKRIERAGRHGAFKELQARRQTQLARRLGENFRYELRPRTKGAKIVRKMEENLVANLVEVKFIKPPSPLITPFTLKRVLPRIGMLYREQLHWDKNGGECGDGAIVIHRSKSHVPLLGKHKKDASIEWAIWAENKYGIKENFERIVARVFIVGIRLIEEGWLAGTINLEEEEADEVWRRFSARLRSDSQLQNQWPSRVRVGRFRHFFCALLNASWYSSLHADKDLWSKDPGPLAVALKAFLDKAQENDSPWYLAGMNEGEEGEERTNEDALWPGRISTWNEGSNENDEEEGGCDQTGDNYEEETEETYGDHGEEEEEEEEEVEENGVGGGVALDEDGDLDMDKPLNNSIQLNLGSILN